MLPRLKHIFIWLCLGWMMLGLTNCLDKIEFARPDSIKNGIAIQGKLVIGAPSKVEVNIRKVFDFTTSPRYLAALEVLVIDEVGNEIALKTKKIGRYSVAIPNTHPSFKVAYGKGYKIRVRFVDGRTFESNYDAPYPVPKPSKLISTITKVEVRNPVGDIVEDEQLSFFIDTPLKSPNNSENSRILWELEGVSKFADTPNSGGRCYIKKDPEPKSCYASVSPVKNYLTFNGLQVNADSVIGMELNSTNFTDIFAEGYYMVVHQQSLSESSFVYWSQVSTVVNRIGSVFQEPAGKIITNFKNIDNPADEVFGYFYATEEKFIRVYVSPEFANYPQKRCPFVSQTGDSAPYCCNCKELKGSSPIKPDWWVE